MATNLTRKQRNFVNEVAITGNATQAALKVYDTDSYMTAANIASENLNKPKIINALEEALPDELLAKIHREGLYATKPIYNDDGDIIAEDADFNARHKYLDSAYKLKGRYAAEKHVNLNVDVEASPEILDLTKKLNELYRDTNEGRAESEHKTAGESSVDSVLREEKPLLD